MQHNPGISEFEVHRLRIGDWMPSAIKSIACDPFSWLVAVGREDGDIDIYDSSCNWCVRARIPGHIGFYLQNLVWSQIKEEKNRLFGISLQGFIFEVDLKMLTLRAVRDTYGGAAWSLAANSRNSKLSVGCDDGAIRIFDYGSNSIEYFKTFPSVGSRILCSCFHPLKPWLFIGCADGSIRCVDENTGSSISRLVVESSTKLKCFILSLIVLSDSTVISGDSRGNLQVWDGEIGVLNISIHQHEAEILAITSSVNETQIFASGADSRVTCIQSTTRDDGLSEWVYSTAHRPHSHDVYSLSVANTNFNNNQTTTLLSGGLDGKLCLYSVENFSTNRPSWILPIPSREIATSSRDASIIAIKHRTYIDLWSFNIPHEKSNESACHIASRIELKGNAHCHTFAMSSNGKLLVTSSHLGTRLWSLQKDLNDESIDIQPILLPKNYSNAFSHSLCFSDDDSKLAVMLAAGTLLILDIQFNKKKKTYSVETHHVLDHKTHMSSSFISATSSLSFSPDGQYLSVVTCDASVYVYDLDSVRLFWRISQFTSSITSTSILEYDASLILIVQLANNELFVYNLESQTILHEESIISSLARNKLPNALTSISLDPNDKSKLFLNSQSAIMRLSLVVKDNEEDQEPKVLGINAFLRFSSRNITQRQSLKLVKEKKKALKKKRKLEEISDKLQTKSTQCSIITLYRSIIHVRCLSDKKLVSSNELFQLCPTHRNPLGGR